MTSLGRARVSHALVVVAGTLPSYRVQHRPRLEFQTRCRPAFQPEPSQPWTEGSQQSLPQLQQALRSWGKGKWIGEEGAAIRVGET